MADPFGAVFKTSTASESKSAGQAKKKAQQIEKQQQANEQAAGKNQAALNEASYYKELGFEMDEEMREEQAQLAQEKLDLQNKELEVNAKVKLAQQKSQVEIAQAKSAASVEAAATQNAANEAAAAQQAQVNAAKRAAGTTFSVYQKAIEVVGNPEATPQEAMKAANFAASTAETLGASYYSPELTEFFQTTGAAAMQSYYEAAEHSGLTFTEDGAYLNTDQYMGYTSAQASVNSGAYEEWYGVDDGFTTWYDDTVAAEKATLQQASNSAGTSGTQLVYDGIGGGADMTQGWGPQADPSQFPQPITSPYSPALDGVGGGSDVTPNGGPQPGPTPQPAPVNTNMEELIDEFWDMFGGTPNQVPTTGQQNI